MESKKKLMIQIPDEIVRNKNFKMDSNTFGIYTYLKFLHFRNFNVNEMEIDHNSFKHKLYIADNRTLKNCLTKLHKNQIILEYINKLPTKGCLKLTFNPEPFKSISFTQLPATILNRIEHIGTTGLRLLFYYESFINRSVPEQSKHFAFPAIETISKDTGLNKETIVTYNEILKKNKFLKIVKHEIKWEGYDDLDKPLFTKYNNHYFVRLENM